MVKKLPRLQWHATNLIRATVIVGVFGVIGFYALDSTNAATYATTAEAEVGILSGNTATVSDASASGGSAVKFGTTVVQPPVTGWPNASNVGLLVPTTRTMSGPNITDTSWFAANGFGGAGTQANPYLVDRVLFTSQVTMGDYDATNLSGKWVKFTNCRFYGSPGNPTPGGSASLFVRDDGPFFIVEDSTLGPSGGTIPSGGPPANPGGTDKGIVTYVPFQARRNNIFGAAIPVYFETERNETTGVLVEDNYVHDIWSAAGDHTDIINGNWHASHVVIRHNYLDGIRTGNTYVTNAFGIYDDPSTSAGIFENWTIDNNYIDRAATMILCTNSTSRFLNPWVLTNNTFTDRFSLTRFSCRAPSTQFGNKDQNGSPLTFQ